MVSSMKDSSSWINFMVKESWLFLNSKLYKLIGFKAKSLEKLLLDIQKVKFIMEIWKTLEDMEKDICFLMMEANMKDSSIKANWQDTESI